MKVRRFSGAGKALEFLLATDPEIIGFGEYHQKTDSAKVRSAIKRFTDQMVDVLAKEGSDLLVETWVAAGNCGKKERQVVKKVEADTKRPESTESEVIKLLKRAKRKGIQPHILKMGCKEYKDLLAAGKLDYVKLLGLITRHLDRRARRLYRGRHSAKAALQTAPKTARRHIIALYGGALHNDLYPHDDLKAFSYAAGLKRLSRGRFLEVDLYVPEYIHGDKNLRQEPWYPTYARHASEREVLLIERGVNSYILIFRRGQKP